MKLLENYPGLDVAGHIDGYFSDSQLVVDTINRSRANIVFVAMGSPKQEEWIARHRDNIHASILMGVGGTFDVVSGRVRRAPGVFQRTGTEWLYRLVREPGRIKRQMVLPKFVWMVVKARLGIGVIE